MKGLTGKEWVAFRRWPWLLLIVAIASAACTHPSRYSDSSPTTTPVPNVEGQTLIAATSMLEDAGLKDVTKTRLTNTVPEETVLRQSPAPGTSVHMGAQVVLLVAEPLPLIPDVVGDKLTRARHALKHAGFDVSVTKDASGKPKSTVISQSPLGGKAARPGLRVELVVAAPPPYNNPWEYDFWGLRLIYSPPSAFCSYFPCIPNFSYGRGYVIECRDGEFSKSGGIQGSCSDHGGNWRPLSQ